VEVVPAGPKLDSVWSVNGLLRRRERLEKEKERLEMQKDLSNLPPDLLDRLPLSPDAVDGAGRVRKADEDGTRR